MAESLLSFTEILLFGRLVDDLQVPGTDAGEGLPAAVATLANIANLRGTTAIDGVPVAVDTKILVREQNNPTQNGLYTVSNSANNDWLQQRLPRNTLVNVAGGSLSGLWRQRMPLASNRQIFERLDGSPPGRGVGRNRHLAQQLADDPRFARIYGFAYEGTYYELPEPAIFLVQGEGTSATDGNLPTGLTAQPGTAQAARAPLDPSTTGVAAADYQIANDIMFWPYDKADYTIRMDVATGMFEQVLLDVYFEYDAPMAGAKVSGAKVSGAKVSGAKVSGAKVSGAKVSGAKARGPSD